MNKVLRFFLVWFLLFVADYAFFYVTWGLCELVERGGSDIRWYFPLQFVGIVFIIITSVLFVFTAALSALYPFMYHTFTKDLDELEESLREREREVY